MLRNIAKPWISGLLEWHCRIKAARDRAVNDGQLLLVEQRDHLPLRPDRPLEPPIRVIQKPHNRRLLAGGRIRTNRSF